MIEAAGVLILTEQGKILFLKRADSQEWAFPGGKIEEGETPIEAATRECVEEIGHCPTGALKPLYRRITDKVDFTTFSVMSPEFTPILNDEHTEFIWRRADTAPGPLHPGAEEVLDMRMRQFTTDREMRFYTTEQLGPKQSMTPEGFLLCEDVPIGRLGTLFYKGDGQEVPIESRPGSGGVVQVERDEGELFHPNCILSFAGKAVTFDHPPDGIEVTPENWRIYAVGTVMHPRRGEGQLDDLMLADLLITDPDIIKDVLAKKIKEVSSGYDCDYEQTAPGRGRQVRIIGNHVALVTKGRCGPRCSIGDSEMKRKTISPTVRQQLLGTMSDLSTIRAAFEAKDAGLFESALARILTRDAEPDEDEDEETRRKRAAATQDEGMDVTDLAEVLGEIAARLDDAEGVTGDKMMDRRMKDGKMKDSYKRTMDARMADRRARDEAEKAEREKTEKETADKRMRDAIEGKENPDDTDEGKKGGAKDSANLETSFHETRARAEILSPGIKFPTYDRRADPKLTSDALCALRRRALTKAIADDTISEIIRPLTGDSLKLDGMPCDKVETLFIGASELVKQRGGARDTGNGPANSGHMIYATSKAPTIAEINARGREFWKNNKSAH
jgi:8-oxo-dGTP pyrophosphatase MutT (NUDIX family)